MPQYPISPEPYDQSIPQIATAKSVVLDFWTRLIFMEAKQSLMPAVVVVI